MEQNEGEKSNWWLRMEAKLGSEQAVREFVIERGSKGGSKKVRKGYAVMVERDPDRQREVSIKGGKARWKNNEAS